MFDAPPPIDENGSTAAVVVGLLVLGIGGAEKLGAVLVGKLGAAILTGFADVNGSMVAAAAALVGGIELPNGSPDCFLFPSSRKSRSPPFVASAPVPNGSLAPPAVRG